MAGHILPTDFDDEDELPPPKPPPSRSDEDEAADFRNGKLNMQSEFESADSVEEAPKSKHLQGETHSANIQVICYEDGPASAVPQQAPVPAAADPEQVVPVLPPQLSSQPQPQGQPPPQLQQQQRLQSPKPPEAEHLTARPVSTGRITILLDRVDKRQRTDPLAKTWYGVELRCNKDRVDMARRERRACRDGYKRQEEQHRWELESQQWEQQRLERFAQSFGEPQQHHQRSRSAPGGENTWAPAPPMQSRLTAPSPRVAARQARALPHASSSSSSSSSGPAAVSSSSSSRGGNILPCSNISRGSSGSAASSSNGGSAAVTGSSSSSRSAAGACSQAVTYPNGSTAQPRSSSSSALHHSSNTLTSSNSMQRAGSVAVPASRESDYDERQVEPTAEEKLVLQQMARRLKKKQEEDVAKQPWYVQRMFDQAEAQIVIHAARMHAVEREACVGAERGPSDPWKVFRDMYTRTCTWLRDASARNSNSSNSSSKSSAGQPQFLAPAEDLCCFGMRLEEGDEDEAIAEQVGFDARAEAQTAAAAARAEVIAQWRAAEEQQEAEQRRQTAEQLRQQQGYRERARHGSFKQHMRHSSKGLRSLTKSQSR